MRRFRSLVAAVVLAVPVVGAGQSARQEVVIVSNERSGDVTVIDAGSLKAVATVAVGKRPRGLAASRDGSTLFVALSGTPISPPPGVAAATAPVGPKEGAPLTYKSADGIGVVDLGTLTFLRLLPAGTDPECFALSGDAKTIYVSNEDAATLSVLAVPAGKVERAVPVRPEPEGVTLSPDGRHCWVTCETDGEVVVVDTATREPVAEVKVGGRPRSVAFAPDGARAYVPSETAGVVHEVDARAFKVIRTLKLPEGARPMGTVLSPDGGRLYVSTGRYGAVCSVDLGTFTLAGEVRVGTRPWGMALSADGGRLYVANGPSNDVSVVDTRSMAEVARVPVGTSPWGVVVTSRPVKAP